MRRGMKAILAAGVMAVAAPAMGASFTGNYSNDFQGALGAEWSAFNNGAAGTFIDVLPDLSTWGGSASAYHTNDANGNRGVSFYKTANGENTKFELELTNNSGVAINVLNVMFDAQVFWQRFNDDRTRDGDMGFQINSGGGFQNVQQFTIDGASSAVAATTWLDDAAQGGAGLVQAFSQGINLNDAWDPGENIVLRWTGFANDFGGVGDSNDKNVNVGIDNLVITADVPGGSGDAAPAVPEPMSAGLALIGLAGLAMRRRKA